MWESTYPMSIHCQLATKAVTAVKPTPSSRKPASSFFFMPRVSPAAPSTGASTATSREAADTPNPHHRFPSSPATVA